MKRVVLVLAGLVVAALAGIAAFIATFDAEHYKPQLAALVSGRTGRALAIDGALALVPSLVPTLAAERVRLANAPWGSAADMLSVGRVEARVALLPLLQGQLRIERIALEGVRLFLEVDDQGRGNWVMGRPAAGDAALPDDARPVALSLAELVVTDTELAWRDAGAKEAERYRLARFVARAAGVDRLAVDMAAEFGRWPVVLAGEVGGIDTWRANRPAPIALTGQAGPLRVAVNGTVAEPRAFRGLDLRATLAADSLADLSGTADRTLPALAPVSVEFGAKDVPEGYAVQVTQLAVGRSAATGEARIATGGLRPRVDVTVTAETLDLRELLGESPAAAPVPKGGRLLPDADLRFQAWRGLMNGTLAFRAGRVILREGELRDFSATVTLEAGKLQVDDIKGAIAGGQLAGTLTLDGAGDVSRLKLDMTLTGVSPAAMPRLSGKYKVEGAQVDLQLVLEGAGATLRTVLAHGNGSLRMDVGPGRVTDTGAKRGGGALLGLIQNLNPLAKRDPATRLECAALRFAIRDGVAVSQDGIGLRTSSLNVLGGGTVNLGTEAIDIGASVKPRQGIGLDLSGLVDFVRLGGTLADPTPVTDVKGVATTGIKVGAAFATAGLSVLAEGLFDRAGANADVCALARGEKRGTAATGAAPAQQKSAIDQATDTGKQAVKGAGDAVEKLFDGLFGR